MPTKTPRSYDEIVRATVPEPDSSFRPTQRQEELAYEGFRALDADEQALLDRVEEALRAHGFEHEQIGVEVDRDAVTLSGQVDDPDALARMLETVRAVDGVGQVVDRLVIATA